MLDRNHPPTIILIAPMQVNEDKETVKGDPDIRKGRNVAQQAFQPINVALYLLGAPRVATNKTHISELTRADKYKSSLKMLLLEAALIISYVSPIPMTYIENENEPIYNAFNLVSMTLCVLLPALLQTLAYDKLHMKLLRNLDVVDAMLPLKPHSLMYGDLRGKSIIFIAVVTAIFVAALLNDVLMLGVNLLISNLPTYVLVYLEYLLVVQYIIDANNIFLRAAFTNDILSHVTKQIYGSGNWHFFRPDNHGLFTFLLLDSKERKKHVDPSSVGVCDVYKAMRIYDKLADEMLILNKIYSFPILCAFIHSFIQMVTAIGFQIHSLIEGDYQAMVITVWVIQYVMLVLHGIVASSRLTAELETVQIILRKLQENKNIEPRQLGAVEDFIRLCESSETSLKPFHLFTVDYSLLSGFFTAVASYAIIILQLLQGSKRPPGIPGSNTTSDVMLRP